MKATALTPNAARQARYRENHCRIKTGTRISATVRELATEYQLPESEVVQHLLRFALCNRDWHSLGFPSKLLQEDS